MVKKAFFVEVKGNIVCVYQRSIRYSIEHKGILAYTSTIQIQVSLSQMGNGELSLLYFDHDTIPVKMGWHSC